MNEENLNNENTQPTVPETPATPDVNLEMPVPEETAPVAPEMPAETPAMEAPVETPAPEAMPAEAPVAEAAPVQPEATPAAPATEDKGSFGWAVLGFFFPLIGFILFLCWKNKRHGDAKKAGTGALVGFLLSVVSMVLVFVVFGAAVFALIGAVEELNGTEFEINDISDEAYVEDYAIDDSAYDLNSDEYSVEVDEAVAEDTQAEAAVEETTDEADE